MTQVLIRKPGMGSVRCGVGDTFLPEGGELVPVAAQQSLDVGARRGGGRGGGEAGQLLLQQVAAAVSAGMSDELPGLPPHSGALEARQARAGAEGRRVGAEQAVSVGHLRRLLPQS